MTASRESLMATARECCARAHAPYSGIHVGAAIRAASGAVYRGSNVENAAYPLGNCAEASAIAAGVQPTLSRFAFALAGARSAMAASRIPGPPPHPAGQVQHCSR